MPLWIKVSVTAFVCLLVPVYWRSYGAINFLWFSDVSLFVTVLALWLESRLLASMMALGVIIPELVWTANFLAGGILFGGMEYLFEAETPILLRALSLFHIGVPVILIWMLARLGYDRRAFLAQTVFAWIWLPLTYVLSDPSWNINWVFGWGDRPQTLMPELLYLVLWMLVAPLGLFLPAHLVLRRFFAGTPPGGRPALPPNGG